ncbi:uncharacterized protein LOC144121939 isoform X6 [Amblyomma americanum]
MEYVLRFICEPYYYHARLAKNASSSHMKKPAARSRQPWAPPVKRHRAERKRGPSEDGYRAKTPSPTETSSSGSRYPRRQRKEINYMEWEENSDEDYPCEENWEEDYLCLQGWGGVPGGWSAGQIQLPCPQEQDLVSFSRYGNIYYQTPKTVGAEDGDSEARLQPVFSCDTCGELFSAQDHLEKHRWRKHPQRPQERHRCAHCPYSSDNKCPDGVLEAF